MKELWSQWYQPADAEIVKRKAASIGRRCGNHRLEADDVAQDLAIHVFEKMHQHDADRGSREKFVKKIVKNKAINLIEHRHAQRRDDRRNIDYDEAPSDAQIGGFLTSEQVDLRIEMQAMADRMPPEVREVYQMRLEGSSEADIIKDLHMSRQRVRTLLQKMERHLREANLDEYLTEQPKRQ